MKKIKITTPENIEVEYDLADLASRTAAASIDMLLQLIVFIILGIGLLVIYLNFPELWERYYGWILGISIIIFAVVYLGYFIIMEMTNNGMTPGKRIMKLRTIRTNGQPITLLHSFIRNFIRLFIDNAGIGVLFIFFNKSRKRIGDILASTIVVSEQVKARPISLEDLQASSDRLSLYITGEEYDLVRDYFTRKESLRNSEEVSEELKKHFAKRLEEQGVLEEFQYFIDSL